MLPVAKLPGEAPSFNAPPVTHLELKGKGVRPFVTSVRKVGWGLGESHVLWGCAW